MATITEFLSAFYPDLDEPIWLLGFPPKGLPEDHPNKHDQRKRPITRKALASNRMLQNNLKADNERLGLYFVVNAGGTEKKDITRVNAVFCEIDEIPIEDQHKLYDQCELKPSIRVETQKSVHAYWLPAEELTIEKFSLLQNGLIKRFSADPKIKNENRVMRLPFFNHVSFDSEYIYKRVEIHTFEPERRYLSADLFRSFPYTPPKQPQYVAQGFIDDTWEGIKQELRFRISRLPTYRVESNGTWATAKGICHDGHNNSALTVNLRTGAVSCKAGCDYERILNTFGLSKPERTTVRIARVPARRQTSELYRHIQEKNVNDHTLRRTS
jgi:hypothetical protein